MSYTIEDFNREWVQKQLKRLSPEERTEILNSLPPKQRREMLESLPAEERREMLESLPAEERLAGLAPDQIRQYLDRLSAGPTATPRKSRRKK